MSDSPFNKVNSKIPEDIQSRQDVICWMLDNGIYIHDDDKSISFNDLCNHMDHVIMDLSKKLVGSAATPEWYKIAAMTKIFYLLTECRAISNGSDFKINKRGDEW